MNNAIFLPEKMRVGFQKRDGTYTGKLAYIIYYDNKGKLRKENSWGRWRDNEDLNTKTEVWLECGKYDKNTCCHDIELDCEGDTYEDAIIELANLVFKEYGEYNE